MLRIEGLHKKNMTEGIMNFRTAALLLLLATVFMLVSCGEESSGQGTAAADTKQLSVGRGVEFTPVDTVKRFKPVRPVRDLGANIASWPLVATGATRCYNHVSEIPCPEVGKPYSGQDGQIRYGTRSYTKDPANSNLIRDDVTGRTWIKDFKQNVTWYEAKVFCDSLNIANKNWRLPTTHELRSLVDYGAVEPAIDSVFYEGYNEAQKEEISSWFWASEHIHFGSDTANRPASSWIVNFFDGFVEYTSRYNSYNVRCVTSD